MPARAALCAVTAAILAVPTVASAHEAETAPATTEEPIAMLVLREDGVGGAGRAREYLAAIVDAVAKVNGWPSATFEYFTERKKAEPWVKANEPSYGILSFGAFLAMHAPHKLSVLGTAKAVGSGGGRYYIVSKNQSTIDGCKGKKLASNHAQDAKYVDKVVAAGAFALSDFTVEHTKRPVQTLKMVTREEAECALIDHAQFEALQDIEGGKAVSTVWFSQEFPSIVVVSYPKAPKEQAAKFRDKLDEVCKGNGKTACERTGVKGMSAVDPTAYDVHIKAYEGG